MSTPNLVNRFIHHPPKDATVADSHTEVRDACFKLALVIEDLVPFGREQALAMTAVEEAMMWANAGIARNQ